MARILLIDDDNSLRALLQQVLEEAGHAVTSVDTGRGAIQVFRQTPLDVVITDVVMPDLDGLELIIMIRKEMPKLPVIAMSGGMPNSPLYLDLAKKLGARSVLQKPFIPEQLFAALKQVLRAT